MAPIEGMFAATLEPVLTPLTRLVTLERTLFASERTPLMLFSRADLAKVSLVPLNMLARLLSLALEMVRIAVKSALVSPAPPMESPPCARAEIAPRFYTSESPDFDHKDAAGCVSASGDSLGTQGA